MRLLAGRRKAAALKNKAALLAQEELMARQWRSVGLVAVLSLAGCQDTRVINLEKRVDHLEQAVHHLEADRARTVDDESARRAKLETCVAEANAEFQRNLVRNGTRARDGSYNVPVPVLAEMQRQKRDKIEECRLLYSK